MVSEVGESMLFPGGIGGSDWGLCLQMTGV